MRKSRKELPGELGLVPKKYRKRAGRPRDLGRTKEPKYIYFFMGYLELISKNRWLVHHLKGGVLGSWKSKQWAIRALDIYNEKHGYIRP